MLFGWLHVPLAGARAARVWLVTRIPMHSRCARAMGVGLWGGSVWRDLATCSCFTCPGQELSTFDKANGRYYIMGYNATTSKPNLVGWDVKTKSVFVDRELPIQESAFVVRCGFWVRMCASCQRLAVHACMRTAYARTHMHTYTQVHIHTLGNPCERHRHTRPLAGRRPDAGRRPGVRRHLLPGARAERARQLHHAHAVACVRQLLFLQGLCHCQHRRHRHPRCVVVGVSVHVDRAVPHDRLAT